MSFKNVYKNIQPMVIDNEMLNKVIDSQRPKGEAGRLVREEGIAFNEVDVLRLEFMRILRIDHMWPLTGLTKLSLSNNLIEKIENLETLVNLKELDLSFNYIEKIEHLDSLIHIEILSLYNNEIKVIENLDNLRQLHVFSIGKNSIEDRDTVFHLRLFKKLRSVNMADNPCAKDEGFRTFVVTFLPQISYYEYIRVSKEERETGEGLHRAKLKEVKEGEKSRLEQEAKEEAEREEAELHAESFIEFLGGRQLFDSLFERDSDGAVMMLMGEEIEQFYKEYEEEFLETTRQLFEVGQEQYKIRKDEVTQFFYCINTARKENQDKSQQTIEDFLDQKRELFSNIKKLQESFDYTDEVAMMDYADQISLYAEDYKDLIHSSWKILMGLELSLFDQIDEENLKFERILTDMVNGFIESAQGLFTNLRNLESRYMEQVNDAALRWMSLIGTNEEPSMPDQLRAVLEDKESLNNCIGASHDMHMQLIDAREDRLVSRAKDWLNNLVDNLYKDEITRSRGKILEINHFLDIQREEFENLQEAPVGGLMDDSEGSV